jgi:hypothetical protein
MSLKFDGKHVICGKWNVGKTPSNGLNLKFKLVFPGRELGFGATAS